MTADQEQKPGFVYLLASLLIPLIVTILSFIF